LQLFRKTFLSRNLDQNKLKNAYVFGKAVTVFSAQTLRTQQQHTLQSFKNAFLSSNLYQNMYKNALFFERKKQEVRCLENAATTHFAVI